MFHKIKRIFIIIFIITLVSCNGSTDNSTTSLEEKLSTLKREAAELEIILNSRYAEEHEQAMEKCKELRKNPNADPNEVAAAEEKVAEIWLKTASTPPFLPVECKYKVPKELGSEEASSDK